MNEREQREYLSLLQKVSRYHDYRDFDTLNSWKAVVTAEQDEYQRFSEESFKIRPNEIVLSPESRKFAENKIEKKLQKVKDLPQMYFPAFHQNESMVRMISMFNETNHYEMRTEDNLLELVS